MRWQIEWLFKRLKQGLPRHRLPVKGWERAQACVHLCLLVCCLQEQEAQERSAVRDGRLSEAEVGAVQEGDEPDQPTPRGVISHWGLARWEWETLRTLLPGSWTRQRVQDGLPQWRRDLVSRPRDKRLAQESEVQDWLGQQLALPQKEVAAA